VTAGGATSGDDAIWIDSQLLAMPAYPADSAAGIFDAFVGRNAVPRANAVVRHAADGATFGHVLALLIERENIASAPGATKEIHHGRAPILWRPILWQRQVHPQLALWRFLICDLLVTGSVSLG